MLTIPSPSGTRGGSQDEEKLAYYVRLCPLPPPRARWLAGQGEGFDYSALSLSLASLALALAVDMQQFI